MITYLLYLITNRVNNKRYIGQTKGTLESRFKKHKADALVAMRGYALHAAIRKYGIENFEIKLLSKCQTLGEANHREAYYIRLFNTLSPNGYNLKSGGDNAPMSEETKRKLSEGRKGERHHFFGKHFSDEHKKNLSLSQKGKRGRSTSEETKRKQSESHKGKPVSKEHREKLSKALMGVSHTEERKENIRLAFWKSPSAQKRIDILTQEGLKKSKPILCHQNGKIYNSLHEASRELGLQRQHIKGTVDGKSKFTKGYSFEYARKEDKK